ncbi:response regulator transcription factor [Gayadomonas joobiniege]|uniref:response regulator transcription factor n=1 Tax=Gayadomonas joobiniege TaxID=1234606 RepID=UPI00036CD585|nr:response regulator transcription factor [Gayadomonas joobiniege]
MQNRVLLVEDNADIANIIKINLSMLDLNVESYDDGSQAYKRLHKPYSLAIFDIMLPGTDGLKLCRRLRQLQPQIAIILLTAKNTELDVVTGLESGADDYLTKPFSVLELQARVKAQLRRVKQTTSELQENKPVLQFAQLTINPNLYQVKNGQQVIDTTAKEFELLYFLAKNPQRVFGREQLLQEIWGMQHHGAAHTVNSTMNRLRAKLESDSSNPKWLKTVWGVGYKFT